MTEFVVASAEGLRHALAFGVTTELDMASVPETMIPLRAEAAAFVDDRIALEPAGARA